MKFSFRPLAKDTTLAIGAPKQELLHSATQVRFCTKPRMTLIATQQKIRLDLILRGNEAVGHPFFPEFSLSPLSLFSVTLITPAMLI